MYQELRQPIEALRRKDMQIERVLPSEGWEEMQKLSREVDFLFNECGFKTLGESFRKPGQVMHRKAWITYINREIRNAKQRMRVNGVLSSHSFRAGFITRHLKHAECHVVAQAVGHKKVSTTLKYNRYAPDEHKIREMLDMKYLR